MTNIKFATQDEHNIILVVLREFKHEFTDHEICVLNDLCLSWTANQPTQFQDNAEILDKAQTIYKRLDPGNLQQYFSLNEGEITTHKNDHGYAFRIERTASSVRWARL